MKKEIYKDSLFEKSMVLRLEQSRKIMQNLLDTWNSLNLQPCTTKSQLYELAWSPEISFQEGINIKSLPPNGVSEKEVQDFNDRLILPTSAGFYLAATNARQDQYSSRELGLFKISKGKVILTNEAEEIIKSKSVYADSEGQVKFAKELGELLLSMNRLDELSYGNLLGDLQTRTEIWGGLFSIPLRADPEHLEISMKPEKLRELISVVT